MRLLLVVAAILLVVVCPAFAQEAGQINGVIADSSGGVIPRVTVTAVESGTGIPRETVSGANGR